jgi:hypothetical protein
VNAAEHFGPHSMLRRRLTGILMKNFIAAHNLPDEQYVVRLDGRVKSQHRRFVDALKAGLQLRDKFPQHDIKVRAMQASGEALQ